MKSRALLATRACRLAVLLCSLAAAGTTAFAAAPTVQQNPNTRISDVYAFVGKKFNDASVNVLNVIVNVRPFSNRGDAFNYDRFSDDVRYSIDIANPNTGALISSYDFRFTPVSSAAGEYKNLGTILSYGRGTSIGAIARADDSAQNFTQLYSVKKTTVSPSRSDRLGGGFVVPPPNVGTRVTPAYNDMNGIAVSGATTNASLDTYTRETIAALDSGEVVWAGPRDDSFFGSLFQRNWEPEPSNPRRRRVQDYRPQQPQQPQQWLR